MGKLLKKIIFVIGLIVVLNFLIQNPFINNVVYQLLYVPSNQVDNSNIVLEYDGAPYVVINNNIPEFNEQEISNTSWETYGALDDYGRCTTCTASIGIDLMPEDDRGDIAKVKPTGWIQAKYDCINGKYLYNRCHLIGFQLTGENANDHNLITGTRYLNIEGMLPFENMVAQYVKETHNHVLYRVIPDFHGDEMVARGVYMQGYSEEDNGEGICFNIYCFNVQPGIEINYQTGESYEE